MSVNLDVEFLDHNYDVVHTNKNAACYARIGRILSYNLYKSKIAFLKSDFKNYVNGSYDLRLNAIELVDYVSVLDDFFPSVCDIDKIAEDIEKKRSFTIPTNTYSFYAFSTVTILRYLFEQPSITVAYSFLRKEFDLPRVNALFIAHSNGFLEELVSSIHSLCSKCHVTYILGRKEVDIKKVVANGVSYTDGAMCKNDPTFARNSLNNAYNSVPLKYESGPMDQLPEEDWYSYTKRILDTGDKLMNAKEEQKL